MKHYRLIYKQPHEYDDDSPSGIGDHQVGYSQFSKLFEARNDVDARTSVNAYLKEGGLNFGFHIGSPTPGLYPRQFVSLVEFKQDRIVKFKPMQQEREKVLRH